MENKWVIFDMDGTLWDAVDLIVDSWNASIITHPEMKREVDKEVLKGLLGQPMDAFARTLFPELPFEQAMALLEECEKLENRWCRERGAKLYPREEETLKQLIADGWHLGIVSNCQSGYIEAYLAHYGFGGYFSDTLCYGDTGLSKGRNIRLMLDRNHAGFGCYIGDTEGDRKACEEAEVPFLWAAYGFGRAEGATPLRRLQDLPVLLKEVFSENDGQRTDEAIFHK